MSRTQKHSSQPIRIIASVLIALGIIGLAVGAWLWWHPQKAVAPAAPSQHRDAPSSVKPTQKAIDTYTVAPSLPKYISIPAIGVGKTRVLQLGVKADNEIATPASIYDAGWYKNSAKPGQVGAMFIFGHVSNWQDPGVFYNLKKLRPGDTIDIVRGDNRHFTYKVVSSKTYDNRQVNMKQVLTPAAAGKPGLNLMTCTGKVLKDGEFTQRLVIFTTLVSP